MESVLPPNPLSEDVVTRVRETMETFLHKLGLSGTVTCRDRRQEHPPQIWVEITTEQSGLLIGERGAHLRAVEHIFRSLLRGTVPNDCRCFVDVNKYRLRRMEFLKRHARDSARRVMVSHHAVTLEPMSAMERRIVHLALSGEALVETASMGQGLQRRVVIRPRDPFLVPEKAVFPESTAPSRE